MDDSEKLIELEPGCHGKSQVLHQGIIEVIWSAQFEDMTLSEILGTLELVKLQIALEKKTKDHHDAGGEQ